MMRFDLTFYLFAWVLLILLLLLLCRLWPGGKTAPAAPKPSRRRHNPQPFTGLTRKPECELCGLESEPDPQVPGAPPPRMIFTRGRRRCVETTGHFCPHATCSYHGWVGWGNIRANGHPNGRRWRQLYCLGCRG